MKAFDLELAKKGFPVCTREGRDARIICFDRNASIGTIVALVQNEDKTECVVLYHKNGDSILGNGESKFDLFMKTAQHTGWVNMYRGKDKTVFCSHRIYKTEEAALAGKKEKYEYVASQQVTWED